MLPKVIEKPNRFVLAFEREFRYMFELVATHRCDVDSMVPFLLNRFLIGPRQASELAEYWLEHYDSIARQLQLKIDITI